MAKLYIGSSYGEYTYTQDINANQTTITSSVYFKWAGGGSGYDTFRGGVQIGGNYYSGSNVNINLAVAQTTLLYTRTNVITHNADGTFPAGLGIQFNILNAGTYSYSANVFLNTVIPTIPRASGVTATNTDIESSTSININRYSSSFTHTLKYAFGTLSGTIATGVATTYGWTIPSTFYAEIPNTKTGTCTITCETYNGATLIGTSTTALTVTANETICKPDVSATITDSNSLTTTLTGNNNNFVKYISNAAFSITATPKNSATIVSQKITCGDGKTSSSASGTLSAVESGTFTVESTDSRGYKTTTSYSKTLVNYAKLTLNATLYRTEPTNNEIAIDFSGNYFNGSFGSQSNTLQVKWRYKENGTTTWSSYYNLTPTISGNTYNNIEVSLGTSFDYIKKYDFEVVAYDKIYSTGTIKTTTLVAEGEPSFAVFEDGIEVKGDITLNGTTLNTIIGNLILLKHPIGSIEINISGTNPSTYIGGTWVAFGTGRTLVGIDTSQTEFNTVEETGGAKTHTLSVDEIPSHDHLQYTVGQDGNRNPWVRNATGSNGGVHTQQQTAYYSSGKQGILTGSRGSGSEHNNLQPYIVVYMWKRTA